MKSLYAVMLFGCAFVLASVQPVRTQNGNAAAPSSSAPVTLKGKLERIKIHGTSLEGNLLGETADPEVSIYLPPSYSSDRNRRYPVIYLLHGYTNTDLGYFGSDGRKLHVIAERVFASGAAREMILVMPNAMNAFGGSMYSNSVTAGDWEGYVAEDLVSYMDKNYRTIASRDGRGLAGHSMGGYGTMRIGMKRPDVFSALYALSSCCLNEGTLRARGRVRRLRNKSKRWRRRAGIAAHRGPWRAPRRGRRIQRTRPSISICRRRMAKWSLMLR